MFSIENDVDILQERGYLKNDINPLFLEFKNILMEQNEDYSEYIKNKAESNIEEFLNG